MDLSRCEPAEALSHNSGSGVWTMVNYEIEQGNGVMLFANSLTDSPSVSLKLNVAGSCGIYLQMLNEVGQGQKRYIPTCYLVSFHNRPGFCGTAAEESMFQPSM